MPKKRMGRPPSENPRIHRVNIRMTEEEMRLLDAYCKEKGITHAQGLRDAIKLLPTK